MEIGYNNPWFFNQFKAGLYYCPDNVLTKIKALNPAILRFPGGTLANYYDVNKPGYGFEDTQAKENYISRHVDLVTRLNVPTIYVANIYQALLKPDQTQYWIDNAMKALHMIPNVTHVEIGNEINISGEFMQCGDKPTFFQSLTSFNNHVANKARLYLEIADKFVTRIKEEFPYIKIGLPLGNYPNNSPRSKEWNRVLRTYTKHDAEIFHLYFETKTYTDTKSHFDRCTIGSQKPIWVTEWSFRHGNQSTDNLDAVSQPYYKQYFKDFPNICLNSNKVEMILQHQLYGNNVYSVIKI